MILIFRGGFEGKSWKQWGKGLNVTPIFYSLQKSTFDPKDKFHVIAFSLLIVPCHAVKFEEIRGGRS